MIQVLPDDNAYLRKLFDAMSSPHAETLLHVLGYVQKDGYPSSYSDWKDFVVDVMEAMEMHDAGQFPDSWFPEHDA
ncbi:hypothetical protein ACEPTZ_31995 [Pseudomonas aeruginosa]